MNEQDSRTVVKIILLIISPFVLAIKGAFITLGAWLMLKLLGVL